MFPRRAGEWFSYTGFMYVMRDSTLSRLVEKNFSFDNIYPVYFCGPTFKGELPIGACGPTTASRMERFFEWLILKGIKVIVGKGSLSASGINVIKGKMMYWLAIGGVGVLYGSRVKSYEILRYRDLGPEALLEIYVEDFPLMVGVDWYGDQVI